MSTSKTNAHNIRILVAVLFLLLTRRMYCFLEHRTETAWYSFVAETLLLLLIYGLVLFRIPFPIPDICLLAGCVGVGCLYGFAQGIHETACFLPMSYFPALLFFLDQSRFLDNNRNPVGSKIRSVFLFSYPWLLLGLILFTVFRKRIHFSLSWVYGLVICICICIVYGLIMCTTGVTRQKGKQKVNRQSVQEMQTKFFFAMLNILLSILYLLIIQDDTLVHIVPMLWLVDLLLLFDCGHPLVCFFSERFRKKQADFLDCVR